MDIQLCVHICSGLLVIGPIYRDIREQRIRIRPVIGLIGIGILLKIISENFMLLDLLLGLLPGIGCFTLSRLSGEWIGKGDCLLILGIGILEGVFFSGQCLILASMAVLSYCIWGNKKYGRNMVAEVNLHLQKLQN